MEWNDKSKILVIDDDETQHMLARSLIEKHFDCQIVTASTGRDGLLALQNDRDRDIALVLLDLEMPVLDGLETLSILKDQYPLLPVIIASGTKDVDKATMSLSMGALDFLSKPLTAGRLVVSIKNALKMNDLTVQVKNLTAARDDCLHFDGLIGAETGLKESVAMAMRAAESDIPILITGETGVGKEVFARALHGQGKRAGKPFVAVNCGAIPENLVESTLFGHEKGSFTGAIHKAIGKFREAEGGTIFLDEVGELPMEAQVKLLRVLQQKEVEPVGAASPIPVDVRVLSATNRLMEEEFAAGRFREDLYFRLNVLGIPLPPLRERVEDIPLLARYFISRFAAQEGAALKTIAPQAMHGLKTYHWPGNVRELENILHRAIVLSEDDVLQIHDFVFSGTVASDVQPIAQSPFSLSLFHPSGEMKLLKECEEQIMSLALTHYEGNITRAAKALGIAKSTFYRRLTARMTVSLKS